ncbi:hypothetical protein [Herbaspirillum lusitanum]|uniref:hypothetical protein n=1 Tax=Herbaspirillum lusitanum TaxID=213312 RepID=UPI0009FDCFF5|nr:hypothetical protein [Herbaspirillum lusitanum]MCW5297941.1 hypothetical protein [Herbaspirillum lusitanum]
MSIEKRLPSRENISPAQGAGDATVRPGSSPTGAIENRETSTDTANKEIAKPEQIISTNSPSAKKARSDS